MFRSVRLRRVLRNAEYPVDAELKHRVVAAAKRVGYVPNLIARHLRGGRQGMVGLVIGNMLDATMASSPRLLPSVRKPCIRRWPSSATYSATRCSRSNTAHKLLEYRVDGIILAGGGFDQWTHHRQLAKVINEIKRAGIAVASLMSRNLDVPVFSPDNEAVGLTTARHIVACGHTKVGNPAWDLRATKR